jgi:hypothetical protein
MDLNKILTDGLAPWSFADLLEYIGLRQVQFARLCGFNGKTVNRWCSDKARRDHWPAPRHAVMLAVMFGMLTIEQREIVRRSL